MFYIIQTKETDEMNKLEKFLETSLLETLSEARSNEFEKIYIKEAE